VSAIELAADRGQLAAFEFGHAQATPAFGRADQRSVHQFEYGAFAEGMRDDLGASWRRCFANAHSRVAARMECHGEHLLRPGQSLFSVTLLDSDTFTVPTPLPDDVSWYPLTLNPLDSMTSVFHVVSSGIGDELTADVNLGQMDPDPVPSAALACPA
jgi:hypothetical protein